VKRRKCGSMGKTKEKWGGEESLKKRRKTGKNVH
jgi:hypothetical protein